MWCNRWDLTLHSLPSHIVLIAIQNVQTALTWLPQRKHSTHCHDGGKGWFITRNVLSKLPWRRKLHMNGVWEVFVRGHMYLVHIAGFVKLAEFQLHEVIWLHRDWHWHRQTSAPRSWLVNWDKTDRQHSSRSLSRFQQDREGGQVHVQEIENCFFLTLCKVKQNGHIHALYNWSLWSPNANCSPGKAAYYIIVSIDFDTWKQVFKRGWKCF